MLKEHKAFSLFWKIILGILFFIVLLFAYNMGKKDAGTKIPYTVRTVLYAHA